MCVSEVACRLCVRQSSNLDTIHSIPEGVGRFHVNNKQFYVKDLSICGFRYIQGCPVDVEE